MPIPVATTPTTTIPVTASESRPDKCDCDPAAPINLTPPEDTAKKVTIILLLLIGPTIIIKILFYVCVCA